MDAAVFRLAIELMNDKGIHLRDLSILRNELADTVSNYCLYGSIFHYRDMDENFDLVSFCEKFHISYDTLQFLGDNVHAISVFAETFDNLKQLKYTSDHDFQLLQDCHLIHMGQGIEMKKIMKMRGFFGMRRNLKKKNKAIMIQDLYSKLMEL